MDPLKIVTSGDRTTAVVTVYGELDISTCPALREVLVESCHFGRDVTLDLCGVTFLDSTALNLFASVHVQQRDAGYGLTLDNAAPRIRRVLQLAGMRLQPETPPTALPST